MLQCDAIVTNDRNAFVKSPQEEIKDYSSASATGLSHQQNSPSLTDSKQLTTVRNSNIHINWQRWTKVIISVSAVTLLATCTPLPGLIDQIKTLGELRVVTRNGQLAYYRGPDDMPEGPEYELARRFADDLGGHLRIAHVRARPLGGGRTQSRCAAHPRGRIWAGVPAGTRTSDLPARRSASGFAR